MAQEILLLTHVPHAKFLEERNREIVRLWDEDLKTPNEISEIYKISERQVYNVLKANHCFIVVDKVWEKKKRIHQLRTWIKKAPETKKDSADLMNQLKEEIEEKEDKDKNFFVPQVTIHNYPQKTIIFSGIEDVKNGRIQGVHATESEGGSRFGQEVSGT